MVQKHLRNAWYCAATPDEIGTKPLGRVILNEPVVLYRREDGTPVALADMCCHRRAPLHIGTVEGDNIRCAYHGMLFNSSGAAIWAQAQERIPPSMRVRSYPVVERHGWIWIWMGDPARTDESLIFDSHLCDQPGWAVAKGMFYVKASAAILIDNVMELSHTAFVHKGTVGSKEDINPAELKWERGDTWVKGTRVARNMEPAPTYVARGAQDMKVDQTKVMKYTPPYNCTVDVFTTEAGRKLGEGRFSEQFYTFNLITPETDTTFFYFWATARDFKVDDQAFHERNKQLNEALLTEDVWILEATQRAIDLNPNAAEVDLAADAGALYARRILKRMLESEANSGTASAGAT